MNINIAFQIAWTGFLRLGEIIYMVSKFKKKSTFVETYVIRSNILFAERDPYVVLKLKRSKTDLNHSGIQIILVATGKSTYPVVALRKLFQTDF